MLCFELECSSSIARVELAIMQDDCSIANGCHHLMVEDVSLQWAPFTFAGLSPEKAFYERWLSRQNSPDAGTLVCRDEIVVQVDGT